MADNPGMVIRVAADLADAEAAFAELADDVRAMAGDIRAATADTVGATDGLEAAVHDTTTAYDDLGRQAPADLDAVGDATADVDTATGGVSTSMLALGAGIGVMAAEAIGALVSLAVDGFQFLAGEVADVVDGAIHLKDRYADFKDELSATLEQSGVLQAGIDSLGRSILAAFGTDRATAIRTITGWIEQGAGYALDFAEYLIQFGEVGVRVFGAVKVPLDAIVLAIITVGERLAALNAFMADTAAQLPGVGGAFDGLADRARAAADTWAGYREEAGRVLQSHLDMATGQGAVFEWTGKVRTAIDDARVAMQHQQEAAAAAATSVGELADANAGLVQGSGEAAVALYTQNEQLEKMDTWSRSIKNQDPLKYLLTGLSKAKPEFDAAAFGLADVNANAILLGENFTKTLTPLEKTRAGMRGMRDDAIDLSDQVHFAAETVAEMESATLSWSDAMDLVRQGKGTMGGTIGTPTKPAGMSTMEFQQMQSDPRTWEILHGYDWAQRGGTGATWNWLDWTPAGGGGGGATTTQNINVNTVMGDKYEIARIVKDALAEDWRSTGARA